MKDKRYLLTENSYSMAKERLQATLFATGNGYMGVRGSFEEYSTLSVQGLYVRGILDEMIEICTPVPSDYYMKKYYFNEERLKDFEKTECGINLADILTIRVKIGDEWFQMYEGSLLSYERSLDFTTGVLTRRVRWKSPAGDVTELLFERFASYADEHLYCQRLTVCPIGHDKTICIYSGLDMRTKTNGQKITQRIGESVSGNCVRATVRSGPKYGFTCSFSAFSSVQGDYTADENDAEGILAVKFSGKGKAVLEKTVLVGTSRDTQDPFAQWYVAKEKEISLSYSENYAKHIAVYAPAFERGNIVIEGDDNAARSISFSCWQTLISACKADSVHGVGAKGLTGEQYHQYVWWDSEIYQMPYFTYTAPDTAKNLLLYRYKTLAQARENARLAGYKGARYAFCSGVTGEECVWSFSNHPFMQDHISADVAFSVLSYDYATGDRAFMEEYGYEIFFACLEYWISRVTKTSRGYEILKVTGTDEHHPFVNNDAYTNYMVQYIAAQGVHLLETRAEFDFSKLGIDETFRCSLIALRDELYLPADEYGMIAQFDGYFDLSRDSEDNEYAQGTQMKHKGYDKIQYIKQPDVVMLYTYNNVGMDKKYYARNFDYYEKMCECSSSLSYAPHAIACADNDRMLSFYDYLKQTSQIDLKNLHGGSEEGIHSGCAAGAWYSVFRGLFGCICKEDAIVLDPKVLPWWKSVSVNFYYRGNLINLTLRDKMLMICGSVASPVRFLIKGKQYLLKKSKLQVELG